MTEDTERQALQDLAQKIGAARQRWHSQIDLAFDELQRRDAELVAAAVQLFGDRHAAAEYFASKQIDYEECDGYAALAAGKRERILRVLGALEYGIYL
jgi:hypothetical protein